MIERTPAVAKATSNPAATLLRAGAQPALVIGGGVVVGCLLAGPAAAASAAFGVALAMVALAIGPLLLRLGRDYSPTGLMTLAVCGYAAVVIGLAVVYALVSQASWLIGAFAAAGLLAGVAAWLAGQARSTSRLRVLLYGDQSHRDSEHPGHAKQGHPAGD
jgi:hypothetical protein